jgi:2-dehydro-3-deoxyphosphooctonate aldolase (KDO 8-P synthase)
MDPRHIEIMKTYLYGDERVKILADVTHPNKQDSSIAGILAKRLASSYIAAGADGIFLETHPEPKESLCDSRTMLELKEAREIIVKSWKLYNWIKNEC